MTDLKKWWGLIPIAIGAAYILLDEIPSETKRPEKRKLKQLHKLPKNWELKIHLNKSEFEDLESHVNEMEGYGFFDDFKETKYIRTGAVSFIVYRNLLIPYIGRLKELVEWEKERNSEHLILDDEPLYDCPSFSNPQQNRFRDLILESRRIGEEQGAIIRGTPLNPIIEETCEGLPEVIDGRETLILDTSGALGGFHTHEEGGIGVTPSPLDLVSAHQQGNKIECIGGTEKGKNIMMCYILPKKKEELDELEKKAWAWTLQEDVVKKKELELELWGAHEKILNGLKKCRYELSSTSLPLQG